VTDVIGQGAPAGDAPAEDLSVIVPPTGRLTIADIECEVGRLKTREFLALLQILTNGIGPGLKDVKLDTSSPEDAAKDLAALLLVALPNAIDEFIVFVQTVVRPIQKSQTGELRKALENPEIDDLLAVAETIIRQEIDDLQQLVGKAQAMWSRTAALFQARRPPTGG